MFGRDIEIQVNTNPGVSWLGIRYYLNVIAAH